MAVAPFALQRILWRAVVRIMSAIRRRRVR